ncbi:MAG: hypothetical protein FWG98_09120 [Candidatus Cloacimonetes bacterium]|nr:hypothetical protein [Candidatus Cloacimonadota bacterium]
MYRHKLLFIVFITLFVLSTNLVSLDIEAVKAIFNEDIDELIYLSYVAESEGRLEVAIEHTYRNWLTNRNGFGPLLSIAMMYNDLNNPEMAGLFLLESVKRSPTSFRTEAIERGFDNVWNNATFLEYRDEAIALNQKKIMDSGYASYVDITTTVGYRTILPDNFNPENEYSVVIYMHDDNRFPTEYLDFKSALFRENNLILVVPNSPYALSFSHLLPTIYSWEIGGNTENTNFIAEYILKINQAIRDKYNVKSMYLSGFNNSSTHAFNIGLQNQDVFDGLISFGGDIALSEIPNSKNEKFPMFVIHGENDDFEIFISRGYDVELFQTANDYDIIPETTQKAIAWILSR